ncbi:MAG: hypothetical protein AMXMBFR64_04830 [Myxococcales bacterium]
MDSPRPHAWCIVRDGGITATCVHCGRMEMLGYVPARALRLAAQGIQCPSMSNAQAAGEWVEALYAGDAACHDGAPCTTETP